MQLVSDSKVYSGLGADIVYGIISSVTSTGKLLRNGGGLPLTANSNP